jgi:hypothetical protein
MFSRPFPMGFLTANWVFEINQNTERLLSASNPFQFR